VADIFREVDEEVRKEQTVRFFKRYGWLVGAVVVLVVVGVGGYEAYKAWQSSERTQASNRYAEILEQVSTDRQAAIDDLKSLAAPGSGGYGLLAAFEEARLLAEDGKRDEAIAAWQRIADSSAPSIYRQLATLLSVQYRVDSGDAAELTAQLTPLLAPEAPFQSLALEMTALIALREGDTATAQQRFREIADNPGAPPAARQRATRILATLPE